MYVLKGSTIQGSVKSYPLNPSTVISIGASIGIVYIWNFGMCTAYNRTGVSGFGNRESGMAPQYFLLCYSSHSHEIFRSTSRHSAGDEEHTYTKAHQTQEQRLTPSYLFAHVRYTISIIRSRVSGATAQVEL